MLTMPHLLDAVKERRSIRKYQTKSVPKEMIEAVLDAAGSAPSAHNAQPWRFVVLVDPAAKRRLADAMERVWTADMAKDGVAAKSEEVRLRVERLASAPALILACLCMDDMKVQPDVERQAVEHDLGLQSLAAAVENLLLAAHSLGLGACWFCAPAFCKDAVRETLHIPAEVEPQALVAVGYPAEKPAATSRKKVGEFCFKDKWGCSLS